MIDKVKILPKLLIKGIIILVSKEYLNHIMWFSLMYACALLMSIICAILFSSYSEVYIENWIQNRARDSDIVKRIYPSDQIHLIGYEIVGNHFRAQNNDPQIQVNTDGIKSRSFLVRFENSLKQDINIAIYYAQSNENFSEDRVVTYTTDKGRNSALIDLPYAEYSKLRIDIGNQAGIIFELESIDIIKSFNYMYINPIFIITLIFTFILCSILLTVLNKKVGIRESTNGSILLFSFDIACISWLIKNIRFSFGINFASSVWDIFIFTLIISLLLFELNFIFKYNKLISKRRSDMK